MANSGGLITPPVSIQDVRQVLGNSSTDLGTLCKASQINMWAKYKPVPYAKIDTTDEFDKTTNKWKSTARWWRKPIALSVNSGATCGFVVPYMDVGSLSGGYPDAWVSKKPSGGANEPYRLTDFANYDHNAVCPFYISLPSVAIWNGSKIIGDARISTPSVGENNLTLNDFFVQTTYIGIAVIVGNKVWSKTQSSQSDRLLDLEGCPVLNNSGISAKIVAFMTDRPHPSWTSDDYRIYSLEAPNITFSVAGDLKTIRTVTNTYQILLSGLQGTDRTAIRMGEGWVGGNSVYSQGKIIKVPSKDYWLRTITLSVMRFSDRSVIHTENITTKNAEQQWIEVYQSDVGTSLQFSCTKSSYTPPTLSDPTDYYIFTYTFNYTYYNV